MTKTFLFHPKIMIFFKKALGCFAPEIPRGQIAGKISAESGGGVAMFTSNVPQVGKIVLSND